ncbi:MAG: PspA/IM30 family protein [Pseudomonadota bacterium]|nr:PspA/IM30 family protein [Pseudomonadota bacterium]
MNIIARLANLFSGFASLFVTGLEGKHPEIAYENSINSLTKKYVALQRAAAAVIARRDEISGRVEKHSRDLTHVNSQLEAALNTNQDDLATLCIQRKNELLSVLEDAKQELTTASTDAETVKQSLMQVKSEVSKLKTERDTMLAKFKSAQARVQINQQLEGLSTDAEVQSLEKVRESIKTTVAQANLSTELRDSDLDVRLSKLGQSAGAVNAKAELAAMKAARAQPAAAKTL